MSQPERALSGLLKLTGLRQLEVSQQLGVSRSCLAGWLAGYSPMPDEMVLKVHRLVSARLGVLAVDRPTSLSETEQPGAHPCSPS